MKEKIKLLKDAPNSMTKTEMTLGITTYDIPKAEKIIKKEGNIFYFDKNKTKFIFNINGVKGECNWTPTCDGNHMDINILYKPLYISWKQVEDKLTQLFPLL